ncbi:MAG TPA: two-component regulator propeller domain-containing protein [Thermoanaerobaculia bacterium]|nr:two-component regulator propeller domain-containing protein [Thermoanaerobaculia bacterium]
MQQRLGISLLALAAITGTLYAASVPAPPFLQQTGARYTVEHGLPAGDVQQVAIAPRGAVLVRTAAGNAAFEPGTDRWVQVAMILPMEPWPSWARTALPDPIRASAVSPRAVAAATDEGLFILREDDPTWRRTFPADGTRSWSPVDVRDLAFDARGRLWFASPQGIGVGDLEQSTWHLFDDRDGLPWNDFTSIAPAPDGSVWLGTSLGLVRLIPAPERSSEPPRWEYRQGKRWLPDDLVRDIAVSEDGTVWAATAGGVGAIRHVATTLADKARHFEERIDRYHRRTRFGFVEAARLERPGDLSVTTIHDSDNDGLWTSMYGGGECFAWATSRDPAARRRARAAFEALRFLSDVPQGGEHAPPPGFPARSILPTDGPDPNEGTLERDRERRATHDRAWKVLQPRWPRSADGEWYWKTDTSSDELDGHYFFYALYHDLVAEGDERAEVRDVVVRITDHLLAHDFALVDHDGQPTRWAVFGPRQINHQKDWWEERGLNSLSMLAYLRIAEHVSGDAKYGEAARALIEDHAYAANTRVPKIQSGPGTGNQSDDEMGFMGLYHLVRYERDPALRTLWAHTFHRYFEVERPERNPLFAFLYAAAVWGESYRDAFDDLSFEPEVAVLEEALDSLERYPLDRVDWPLRNSHRLDVEPLAGSDPASLRGRLRDGRVLPIDERFVDKWNHDPWRLDYRGEGLRLADPASFLLPYYLGLYHGFLEEADR